MNAPSASIILSTYNQPDWLERALVAYARQSTADFELIVADDGSGDDTRARIDALRPTLPFLLKHVWHADQGFRKCTILNRAIEVAAANYLIFSDGDCLPRADFVGVHLHARAPRRFLSGGYCKLPRATSAALDKSQIERGAHTDPAWLRAHGVAWDHRLWKLSASGWRAGLLNAITPARASWNGHNASGWRRDIESVNGFDERMQYGGEDRELGERLENAGIRGKRVRYQAVVVHLDHDRGYVRPEMLAANRRIRDYTARTRATWTEFGLCPGPRPAQRGEGP